MEKEKIFCETAKRYIRLVFASMAKDFMKLNSVEKQRHDKALDHIREIQDGHSVIVCQKCWDYYMGMKQKHCGG